MEKSFQESNLSGLGMGTWGIGEDASKKKDELAALRYGLDNGIKVIDTAEMYGEGKSEKLIGEAIRGYDRSKIFLISKFYPYHASPELERRSLEKSLKRLGTDYLDLYLLQLNYTFLLILLFIFHSQYIMSETQEKLIFF